MVILTGLICISGIVGALYCFSNDLVPFAVIAVCIATISFYAFMFFLDDFSSDKDKVE